MINIVNDGAALHFSVTKSEDMNPFRDSIGFDYENFVCNCYGDVSQDAYNTADLNLPFHMYKYLMCKMFSAITKNEWAKHTKQQQLEVQQIVEEVKIEYEKFSAKQIPMTPRELKFVKSAYGLVQLVETALNFKMNDLQELEHFDYRGIVASATNRETDNKLDELNYVKLTNFDFDKFKEICSDILAGNIGESFQMMFIQIIFATLPANGFQITQFLLGMISETRKRSRQLRENFKSNFNIKLDEAQETTCIRRLNHIKLWCLLKMFGFYHDQKMFGAMEESKIPAFDYEKGKMLMDMLKNHNPDDEFYKVPMKVENYDEAVKVFKLILKLSKEKSAVGICDDELVFEGLARGYLAVFCDNISDIIRFSQKSIKILEKIEDSKVISEPFLKRKKGMIHRIKEINCSRIMKYEWNNYLKNKTDAKLAEVKELALKRYNVGEASFPNQTPDCLKFMSWHMLEMLVCQSRILKNRDAYVYRSQFIVQYLIMFPETYSVFCETAGIRPDQVDPSDFQKTWVFLINNCNFI